MRVDDFEIPDNLLFCIPPGQHDADNLKEILQQHPEVRFASLVGVDIAGNDTDEKIPVRVFIRDMKKILSGGIQTDGSSVVMPGIATINDAKVDLIADLDVNWYVDYNFENVDRKTGLPWGTLRIPAFLQHGSDLVCSRALLKRALDHFGCALKQLYLEHPEMLDDYDFEADDIESISITAATELECWVRTPDDDVNREKLSTSQGLKEQYWKRTKGIVRTALEQSIHALELYGFRPEMGHKEVGGVKAHLTGEGTMDHIVEQLEIDWEYAEGMQAADNELSIRILIKEIFRLHGLEASFMAKPIPGVAGNGEHLHINATAQLRDGRKANLFSPADFEREFLSETGWGALMGMLEHYNDLIAPFVTSSNDAFNRLTPGFEAPTHACASIGASLDAPARNRTVLIGLIRDSESIHATRFELRSPNPHSNLFFTIASVCQCMLDGIRYALSQGRTASQLEAEFMKKPGEPALYLSQERLFVSEDDIFTYYTEAERDRLFGKPAASVYETLRNLMLSDHLSILMDGHVFTDRQIRSFAKAMLDEWELELRDRLLDERLQQVRRCQEIPSDNPYDQQLWQEIQKIRTRLAQSTPYRASILERIRRELDLRNLRAADALQREMNALSEELEQRYNHYVRNLF